MDIKVCPDTGNEEIRLGSSKIGNAIRLVYRPRGEVMVVIANTAVGSVSAEIPNQVLSHLPPWSGGRVLTTHSGVNISLNDADYAVAVAFLKQHGVTVVEDETE